MDCGEDLTHTQFIYIINTHKSQLKRTCGLFVGLCVCMLMGVLVQIGVHVFSLDYPSSSSHVLRLQASYPAATHPPEIPRDPAVPFIREHLHHHPSTHF